jgi:hypothetical protein
LQCFVSPQSSGKPNTEPIKSNNQDLLFLSQSKNTFWEKENPENASLCIGFLEVKIKQFQGEVSIIENL